MIHRITTYGDEVELNISQTAERYYISDAIFIETRVMVDQVKNIILANLWINSENATIGSTER